MEPLTLFNAERTTVARSGSPRTPTPGELDEAVCHDTELFLADHLEREGGLAQIQVALALCDAAGSRDRTTLEDLTIDRYRFPRSAHAIERVAELLSLAPAERPEGFWPRFLLDQLQGPGRS
jgi:hypothetical protein